MEITLGEDRLIFDELSYLDEPLHDLLFAGLSAALRRVPSTIDFDNEGAGLSRLGFELGDFDEPPKPLVLKLSQARRKRAGETGWSALGGLTTDSEAFARAVLVCADAVLARHGPEDYDRRWDGEGFPMRALEALRSALSVRDPLGSKYREDGAVSAPS